jgi:tetratricopeptide (TPR) repeat protein
MDRLTKLPGLLGCALWLAGCAHAPEPQSEQAGSTLPVASTRALPSSVPFVSPTSYEGFIRGELYAARGDDVRAISAYRAAIELGESDPFLVAQLAEALDRSGQTAAAEAQLEAALAKHPRSEALLLASARIARRSGHEARALSAYARAQEVASAPAAALERIGYLRELGGAERSVEALKALAEQHAGLHKGGVRDRLRIELELALAERTDGEVARCARDWLALGGGDPALTRRAAETLLAQGHAALALELLAAVAPSELDTPLRLRAALALGRSAECEHILSSMPPHWLGGPLAMAEAYLRAGRPDQALRVLQESESTQDAPAAAARRAELIARALAASGRAHEAAALLGRTDARAATCEALQASALSALARDAGCKP